MLLRDKMVSVVMTPTLLDLLQQARDVLVAADTEFSGEVNHENWRAQVSRLAIRKFSIYLATGDTGSAVWWTKAAEVYGTHRAQGKKEGYGARLKLNKPGKDQIESIRAVIELSWIYDLVAVKGRGSYRLPSVQILIFALQFVISPPTEETEP